MKTFNLILLALMPVSLIAQYSNPPAITQGTLSVRGEATVYVVPDIIRVRFGIETNDMALPKSQSENRAILNRALKAFRDLGIDDTDIKTDFLEVEPRYYRRNNREDQEFLGYYSQNGFVVTVKDKETLEQAIDAALAAGVNYLHGVEFLTSDLRHYRDKARDMAAQAAREKGAAMAEALGAKLGPPININVDNGHNRWWYHGSTGWNSNRSQNGYMTQNAIYQAPANNPGTDGEIQLGKIAVQAGVNVSFQLVTVQP